MLAEVAPDMLSVVTSDHAHADIVVDGAQGSPAAILCEKPIATTLADADRMIAACEASGASLHVGYSLRFNRPYLVGKQQILDGKLGRIVSGAARHYHTKANGLKILARSEEAT